MLESLRASLGSWVSKVFIGLLVASFALWGIADYTTSGASSTAITVGDTKVGINEYQFSFNRQLLIQSQNFGRRLTTEEARAFGVEQQVVSELVTGAVMDEQARLLGLGVSDAELANLIGADAAFQDDNGNFNRRIFDQTLYNANLRAADYVTLQKAASIRRQVTASAVGDVGLPKVFFDALEAHGNEARKLSFITLPQSLVGEVAAPSQAALTEYFDENKLKYRAPEYRKVSYLRATAGDLADLSQISDDKVKEEYEARIGDYTQQSERQIEQILITSEDMRTKIVAALADGGDFAAVETALGLQAGQQTIGTFTKAGVPDPVIANTAFEMASGTTSEIIKGTFGDLIIRVTETRSETIEPLAAVADSIREKLAVGDAADALLDVFNEIEDDRALGKTLGEIAAERKLELAEVTLDNRAQSPEGTELTTLPSPGEFVTTVFQTEVGQEVDPLRLTGQEADEGYVWLEVADIQDARDRTLDEITERVTADWISDETARLLQITADKLVKKAQGGAELDTLAEPLGLTVVDAGDVTRTTEVADLPSTAIIEAFDGGVGHVASVSSGDDGAIVVVKADKSLGGSESKIIVTDEIRTQLSRSVADGVFGQLIGRLQVDLPAQVNSAAIAQSFQPYNHGGQHGM